MNQANGIIVSTMKDQKNRGFTILELTLAMTFLSFIMLFVMTVLLQIMNIYNKGIAMTQINQVGRQINDDISSKARFTTSDSVVYKNENRRLCVGGVSYLWNTEEDRTRGSSYIKNYFSEEVDVESRKNTNLGVVRVEDVNASYCSDLSLMPSKSSSEVSSLARKSVSVLDFEVALSTSSDILEVNIVLSTSGSNKPVSSDNGWKCLNSDNNEPNQYCAFGEFNFLIYMRGGI